MPSQPPQPPPGPKTHDPTKRAGATAQPAEPEPNPTERAVGQCVYTNHKTHRAGAQPAATRNTNSDPVSHTVRRPVRAPAQGGQREEQANPPLKKNREGGKPQPPTNRKQPNGPIHPTSAHLPAKGKRESWRDSHTTAKLRTHSTEATLKPGNTKGDAHGTRRQDTERPPRPAQRQPATKSPQP